MIPDRVSQFKIDVLSCEKNFAYPALDSPSAGAGFPRFPEVQRIHCGIRAYVLSKPLVGWDIKETVTAMRREWWANANLFTFHEDKDSFAS